LFQKLDKESREHERTAHKMAKTAKRLKRGKFKNLCQKGVGFKLFFPEPSRADKHSSKIWD
jgi:hypothetical protein